jgi:hypothetical protein
MSLLFGVYGEFYSQIWLTAYPHYSSTTARNELQNHDLLFGVLLGVMLCDSSKIRRTSTLTNPSLCAGLLYRIRI